MGHCFLPLATARHVDYLSLFSVGEFSLLRELNYLLLLVHVAAWTLLAVFAARNAGPYTFASCWTLIPAYIPPVAIAYLAAAAYSILVLTASVFTARFRNTIHLKIAAHLFIVVVGTVTCALAARAAVGPVSCL